MQMREHIFTTRTKHRPDEISRWIRALQRHWRRRSRRQDGKSFGTGPTQKTQKNSLGTIIRRVARRHDRSSGPNRRLLKSSMPRLTSPRLHVRSRRYVNSCDLKRNAEFLAKPRHEIKFTRSFGTEAVIHAMRHDGMPQRAS